MHYLGHVPAAKVVETAVLKVVGRTNRAATLSQRCRPGVRPLGHVHTAHQHAVQVDRHQPILLRASAQHVVTAEGNGESGLVYPDAARILGADRHASRGAIAHVDGAGVGVVWISAVELEQQSLPARGIAVAVADGHQGHVSFLVGTVRCRIPPDVTAWPTGLRLHVVAVDAELVGG